MIKYSKKKMKLTDLNIIKLKIEKYIRTHKNT